MRSIKISNTFRKERVIKIKETLLIHKKKIGIIFSIILAITLVILFVQEIQRQVYVKELLTSYQAELTTANVTDKSFIVGGIDQTNLLINLIGDIYFENPEKGSVEESLDTNIQKLSIYFAKHYTEEQKIQYINLWRDYLKSFIDYTNAKKQGDIAEISTQLSNMTGYPSKIATFYNTLNQNFSIDLVNLIFADYSSTIKTIIDTYQVNDYKGVYMNRSIALNQIEKINTLISNAIENSFK